MDLFLMKEDFIIESAMGYRARKKELENWFVRKVRVMADRFIKWE
jgi:hypothetical protein